MARRRLLVALVVPGAVGLEVDGLRLALGDSARPRIPPHVTLVPPANVAEVDLTAALAALRRAAARTRPLDLVLGPVATFHPVNPVLHLAVEPVEPVGALRDALVDGPWRRPPERAFVPHVTVCRSMPVERIEPAMALLSGYRRSVTFRAVQLLELVPSGARRRWQVLAEALFDEGPVRVGTGGLETELSWSTVLDPEGAAVLEQAGVAPATAPAPDDAPDDDGAPGWWQAPGSTLAVVARREGQAVGALVLDPAAGDPAAGRLASVGVVAEHRRQGVGRLLLRHAESLAAGRHVDRLHAAAPEGSPLAAALDQVGWSADGPGRWSRRPA